MHQNHLYTPCAALQPYVSAIHVLQSAEPFSLCLMPQADFTLSFIYQGAVYLQGSHSSSPLPAAVINGSYDSYKRCHITRDAGMILVKFKPGGVSAFFDFPGPGRFPCSCRLSALADQQALLELEADLRRTASPGDKVRLMEDFLCQRLRSKNYDTVVEDAVQQISAARGNIRIGELSKMLYISESQFEKRFRKAAGISAKKYASLVRISNLIKDSSTGNNITGKAYEAGYFDQAHFIRDFKAHTGYTPFRFYKLRTADRSSFMPLGLIEPIQHGVSA